MKAAIRLALTSLAIIASSSFGQTFPLDDGPGGATCDYFNLDGRIRWAHRQGDWKDATGTDQGDVPFSKATVTDTDRLRSIEWDVTSLVKDWRDGTYPNHGFLLGPVQGGAGGESTFFSREADDPRVHPRLELVFSDGTRDVRLPVADTYLHCSTVQSIGTRKTLSAGVDANLMLLFDVGRSDGGAQISRATLVMTTTEAQFGRTVLGVFRLNPPLREQAAKREVGLAAAYRHDRGIAKDPDVLMATGFDSSSWRRDWSYVSDSKTFDVVKRDAALSFEPLLGGALRVRIPAGGNLGLDMGYNFKDKIGSEPEEIYFRYYLRFAADWHPFVEGGKLPGLSGTYGVAGWGGRKSDGTNGWSLRGLFLRMPERGSLHDITPIGTYAYHAETTDIWGDQWLWSNGQRGLLQRNRWYCIEQYVRVNSVGQRNGVMRAWVDGELAFEKTDLHLRDILALKIEKVWMNVYYGGSTPSPYDQHLFIDNVVVARRYIGPMASE
jgi:hypothetical protein